MSRTKLNRNELNLLKRESIENLKELNEARQMRNELNSRENSRAELKLRYNVFNDGFVSVFYKLS